MLKACHHEKEEARAGKWRILLAQAARKIWTGERKCPDTRFHSKTLDGPHPGSKILIMALCPCGAHSLYRG
jgi:hypothetical protein